MVDYRSNELYYLVEFSEFSSEPVHIISFSGVEEMSLPFCYNLELITKNPALDNQAILNKAATFTMTRGQEDPIKIYGIINKLEQYGKSPDYVYYQATLVPRLWRLALNFQSIIFQQMNIEQLVTEILKQAGFTSNDFRFDLSMTYPEMEYIVQYRETDLNFINRRLEHFGIFYYFDHSGDRDVVVFTDDNNSLPTIASKDALYFNPSFQHLTTLETISELTQKQRVVTGQVKLSDYNYRHPDTNLLVENQIDKNAPGTFYEYGDHYKDIKEGEFLARVRNEEIFCQSAIFYGASDCRLLHAGHRFSLSEHYRSDWNDEYVLTRLESSGNQHALFPYLPSPKNNTITYENQFTAISIKIPYRPPRITPIPRISGIMTARLESGNKDEYAFLDDQGRYKFKSYFDLSDKTDAGASSFVRLSQPYSGPGYGIHFPNHADAEIIWACIDGNVDRPLGLGTVPNPHNMSPSLSGNKAQSVIRTAGQNELSLDDTTGSENIYLHATKDWTIDVVNDKNQKIGNNESASVGNCRTRDVAKDESVNIGENRTKSVGKDESESIGDNKSISVGKNHKESIGANADISIGKNATLSVGDNSSEDVGSDKSVQVGKDITINIGDNSTWGTGKDFAVQVGKKTMVKSDDDFSLHGDKKGVIEIKDQLTIKCGDASITMKKNGDIVIKGGKISVKGSKDVVIKGSKIAEN